MSVMVAVWVVVPLVPVTVIGYVPAATVEATVIVAVDVPEPGAAKDVGFKVIVTPDGCPEAVSATVESKPPEIDGETIAQVHHRASQAVFGKESA